MKSGRFVISSACPWLIEALATVAPDRQRPDIYDERSPYTHVLDALRYWAVNEKVHCIRRGHRTRTAAAASRPWMSRFKLDETYGRGQSMPCVKAGTMS